MIPAPVPVFPIVVILVGTAGVFFYASFLAGRGMARSDRGTKAWRRGLVIAGAAAMLVVATAVMLTNVLATHDRNYSQAVWASLSNNYGVRSAITGQGFQEGSPFAAIREEKSAVCTVTLPQTVVCDGESVTPLLR